MEIYTLGAGFRRQDVIDDFYSVIWTERFYGDSEVELVVPLKQNLINKLAAGKFLAMDKSDEPMIIETFSIEDGQIKVMGISLLSWLNNRFIRTSWNHRTQVWNIKNQKAGEVLWIIVREMCTSQSSHLGNYDKFGVPNSGELAIPNLKLDHQDTSGKKINKVAVPYGPVYDALRKIAEQHKIGMKIWLQLTDASYNLRFRSYKGTDRTSRQEAHPTIRFSPIMDSFANVKELRSTAEFKTLVYSFASGLEKLDTSDPDDHPDSWLQRDPGVARRSPDVGKYTGFELRAKMIMVDDFKIRFDLNKDDEIPAGSLSDERKELERILDDRANKELRQNDRIQTVDGEVAPTNLFQYGKDYFLGDLIEVQGNTDKTEVSRVTEYIRTQDADGEKSYPTVEAVDP